MLYVSGRETIVIDIGFVGTKFEIRYTSEEDPTWVLKQQIHSRTGELSPVAYIWHEGCEGETECHCGGWSSTYDTIKGYCHHCGVAVPQDIFSVWVLFNGDKNEYINDYYKSQC